MKPILAGWRTPDHHDICVLCASQGTQVPPDSLRIFGGMLPSKEELEPLQLKPGERCHPDIDGMDCGRCGMPLGKAARKLLARLTEQQKQMFLALQIPFENIGLFSGLIGETQVGVVTAIQDLGGGNQAMIPIAVLCDPHFLEAVELRDTSGDRLQSVAEAMKSRAPEPDSVILSRLALPPAGPRHR
jgi:hypothetical protein